MLDYSSMLVDLREPYNLELHYTRHTDGINRLREETYAQPLTLKKNDTLSNLWKLAADATSETGVGTVLRFSNRKHRVIPPRIPLQLLSEKRGVLPENLQIGDVLETGCVILDDPQPATPNPERDNQEDTRVFLTGGQRGNWINAPSDLEIAVYGHLESLDFDTAFGQFVLKRLNDMKRSATVKIGNAAAWRSV